jgi:hypothetical protein
MKHQQTSSGSRSATDQVVYSRWDLDCAGCQCHKLWNPLRSFNIWPICHGRTSKSGSHRPQFFGQFNLHWVPTMCPLGCYWTDGPGARNHLTHNHPENRSLDSKFPDEKMGASSSFRPVIW